MSEKSERKKKHWRWMSSHIWTLLASPLLSRWSIYRKVRGASAEHNQVISRKLVSKDQNSRKTDNHVSGKKSNEHSKWKNTKLFIEWNLAFDSSLFAIKRKKKKTHTNTEEFFFWTNIKSFLLITLPWFHLLYSNMRGEKMAAERQRESENGISERIWFQSTILTLCSNETIRIIWQ